ncbi:unnamed protein product (macronuclear) [Paramecium tetraurelia]|uniref:Uncharacterized protein n=1 Tax=Paramecium tetraurelia TaxID=5888 RepID=A0BDR1_PARTE|nr:uncharacterized protein GSPATT00027708001 [Paramecium tetraurelia]CAK56678.1 unnamed protein product [Paramecium tetraurelia]|eukprot:XP_001424076.1 hypothetical protein (macronuclear) [Paramecium tetraurelia strain d4-2]
MNQSIFAYGFLNNGLVYSKQGKFEKAIIEYNKAIEESPQYAAAYQNRANAYQGLMNFDEALGDYCMAIRINPQYSAAYFNRGLLFGKQGKFEEAIMDYTQYIKMVPDNAQAYNNRANAYQNQGNFNEAIKDYSKSIEINPNYAAAYNNRDFGNAYVNFGKFDEAISDCTKAIELQMVNSDAFYIRGNAYKNQEKYQEAIIDYSRAVEINPQHSNTCLLQQRQIKYVENKDLFILIKNYSIKQFQITKEPQKIWQQIHCFLYFSLKQFGKANQYFESALEYSSKVSVQQRLQFQLSKEKMLFLQQKVDILRSIYKELQIAQEEISDLLRTSKISQTQHQYYQFKITKIENQFLQLVPNQSKENQVEEFRKLKQFMEEIICLRTEIVNLETNQIQGIETLIQKIKQINSFQQTKKSNIQEFREQMSPSRKLYHRSLFWHLFNYFNAVKLISEDLAVRNVGIHYVKVLEMLPKSENLKDQDQGSVPHMSTIFSLLNSALDSVENIKNKKFESRINALRQTLQVFTRFPSEFESEIERASLFMANNINFCFEKFKTNPFNQYVDRISILEFDFEQYSKNNCWKTGILHTLIILKYLIENFQEIILQYSFYTFKDILHRSITEFNFEYLEKTKFQDKKVP